MTLWLGVPTVSMIVGWLLGRWRGVVIALATSFAWLATLRLALAQGPSQWPSLVGLAPAIALLVVALGLGSELLRTRAWVQRSHRHHPETGLVEADSFAEVVDVELHRALRYDRPFSLIYLRCDSVGTTTAAGLTAKVRSVDLVANLRAGEFAVLLPETDAGQVTAVVRRLQEGLAAVANGGPPSAAAVGAVTVAGVRIEAHQMIGRARELMLESALDETRMCRREVIAAPSPGNSVSNVRSW
jgi:GGDEF domain-containing protein